MGAEEDKMIIELKDRKIICTPEEYREMLLKGLIGDGPIWTGNTAADTPPKFPDPEDYMAKKPFPPEK